MTEALRLSYDVDGRWVEPGKEKLDLDLNKVYDMPGSWPQDPPQVDLNADIAQEPPADASLDYSTLNSTFIDPSVFWQMPDFFTPTIDPWNGVPNLLNEQEWRADMWQEYSLPGF